MSPLLESTRSPAPTSLAAGLFFLSCVTCTPLSTPTTSPQTSDDDAGSDDSPDAKRGDGDGDGDGDGEDNDHDEKPGQGSAMVDVCRGNADATVCDSAGTMFRCDGNGEVESSERCASPQHCQIGIAARSCASCLPGQSRCSGDAIEACDKGGQKYSEVESCHDAAECEQAFCRTSDSSCQRRPAPVGAACSEGHVCDGAGACVECTADLHCGANANCLSNSCRCKAGFVANPSGGGCNFDDCARPDDNHCAASGTSNTCKNTVDGYDCTCAAPWKPGADQCFQGGTSADVRTVKNGASWNVFPEFGVACDNAFDPNAPCTSGQLTWLNVCGLPDTKPNDCSAIMANTSNTLLAANVKRVAHTGPLQDYGEPNGRGVERVLLPAVGDVILVQTVVAAYLMRISAVDGGSMTYEWAVIWRDACWRPGGLTCTAACSCPDGN